MSGYRLEVEQRADSVVIRAYVDGQYHAAEGRNQDDAIKNLVAFLSLRVHDLESAIEATHVIVRKRILENKQPPADD